MYVFDCFGTVIETRVVVPVAVHGSSEHDLTANVSAVDHMALTLTVGS